MNLLCIFWKKAKLFNDDEFYKKIMKEKDPQKQKAYGRQVKNFDQEKWEKIARDIVYKANYAKFSQHPDLYDFLIQTEDKIIVEASPYSFTLVILLISIAKHPQLLVDLFIFRVFLFVKADI